MISLIKNNNFCKSVDRNSIVYKDECLYCFDSVDSQNGLFICMNTFIGVCKEHLDLFYNKCRQKNRLFLNIKVEKRMKKKDEVERNVATDDSEYKSLLEKAFLSDNYDFLEINKLILLPEFESIDLPYDLPLNVANSVKSVLCADSVAKSLERGTQGDSWDGNYIMQESKLALSLEQLDNKTKIAPSGWKCNFCDLTTNLWMNLTDGTILCGRKFFDGSGGNNHAVEYFQKTQYPLAVKLGTITPKGADVFSYIEDDMVIDPLLGEHLAHFGIDIMTMEKTDKSIEEMTLEKIKLNREQIMIMEAGLNQEKISGPGLIGIVNTGNSCYMNSVLQVLFSLAPFKHLYFDNYDSFITRNTVNEDVTDFRCQISKLVYYLHSDRYSAFDGNDDVTLANQKIVPQLLRYIIGKGHQDFSTKQQQDAFEYLIHVLNLIKIDIKKYGVEGNRNPLESVAFKVEDRIFCQTSGTVKYQSREEFILSLSIAMDKVINTKEIEVSKAKVTVENVKDDVEVVRPIVHLQSCFDLFMDQNIIHDYNVNGKPGIAYQSSKIETFPEYLLIHLKRFTVGADWTPKKLDVEIQVPDEITLSTLKAKGPQPNEILMKNEATVTSPKVELSQCLLDELLLMGFPENACKKAVFLTGNTSLEEAANWLMMHIGEADFEELPAQLLQSVCGGPTTTDVIMCDENDIDMMINMGFSRKQATRALQETGNLERAADWAFNHPEEIQEVELNASNPESVRDKFVFSDGDPTYTLTGLISHMGNNAHVGHYVCHIKQADGSWVLFNDETVQKSLNPPKKFAYLYLFKRNN